MRFVFASICVGLLALTACGSSSEEAGVESQTAEGEAGLISCMATPEATPSQGANTFHVMLTDKAASAPLEGAMVMAMPWMPSMGHGSNEVAAMDMGGGDYHAEGVTFTMGGSWELKVEVTKDAMTDTCVFTYEVP